LFGNKLILKEINFNSHRYNNDDETIIFKNFDLHLFLTLCLSL